MNWELGNKLMAGMLLLGGVAVSQPAYALQPWTVGASCSTEGQQVINETIYQLTPTGGGITKEQTAKGIIGSVLKVDRALAVYDNVVLDYTLRNLALTDAQDAVASLNDKLTALATNSKTASVQGITLTAIQKIQSGRTDVVGPVSYTWLLGNPTGAAASSISAGPHDGVSGDLNLDPIVSLSFCVNALTPISAP